MTDRKIGSGFVPPARVGTASQSGPAPVATPRRAQPAGDGFEGISAPSHQAQRLGAQRDTDWWGGRPLGEARNAHQTNTVEEFDDAQASSANFFEGDVRLEIDGSGLEMRHDRGHESGDNLTLGQWLDKGRDSGRGLKLDIKEPQHMAGVLEEVRAAGIPDERLMFNLGFGGMAEWGAEIREQFPNAYLAINPPTEGTVGAAEAEKMVEQARQFGGPVTFVVRHDKLSDEAIRILSQAGPVSVWGSGVQDVPGRTAELKERGVTGMIDLSGPHSIGPGEVIDGGKNWIRTGLDKLF